MLKGKKTFITVIVGVIVNGAVAMGIIPESILPVINPILMFLGLGALRLGVKK